MDTPIIVLGRSGSEQHDMRPEELRLFLAERALIDRVTSEFQNVLLILNTAGIFELGFLNEYPQIRAVLSIGYPARTGMRAVARIMNGKANPSGRLTDTFWYNTEDHPAFKNTGTFRYKNASRRHFLMYKEDIYVGYRYTETFLSEEDYAKKVQFPFGFGLSYTTFEWNDVSLTQTAESISVAVTVKNTGSVPGKDVVEVFVEAPYDSRIEKSKKVLAGFEKTGLLQPGETESVTLTIPKYAFMSFDAEQGAYILDNGNYRVLLSSNAHTVRCGLDFNQETPLIYTNDPATGRAVQRRFSNYEGTFQRLSRKDGPSAMPASPADDDYIASKRIISYPNLQDGPASETPSAVSVPKSTGILLADLKKKAWDDPMWEDFLAQFSVEDMAYLIVNADLKM